MVNIKIEIELIIIYAVFWSLTILLIISSIWLDRGNLVYTLDDTYIHMAMAKNIVEHGIWGVDKYNFTSTSSSILYVLILSFSFLIGGVNEITPLVLNLIFANLLLYLVYIILKKENFPSYMILIASISMIIFIPLPSMVLYGMEHVLHILLTIIVMYLTSKILSNHNIQTKEKKISFEKILLLIIPLLSMVRYEGIFYVIIISFFFLLKKRIKYSLLLLMLGFLPIIIYGCISVVNGWLFLPNSIILKIKTGDLTILNIFSTLGIRAENILFNIIRNPQRYSLYLGYFIIAIIFFLFNYFKKKEIWNEKVILCLLFILNSILHLLVDDISITFSLMRYDAYIIASGIWMIIFTLKDYVPSHMSFDIIIENFLKIKKNFSIKVLFQYFLIFVILSLTLFASISRGINLMRITPIASKNIYEQQYQMGLFLQKYYSGKCVAANDIGAINFLADIKCLDLWGLANMKILNATMNGTYDTNMIYQIAKEYDCKIAIVYEFAYDSIGGLPSQWVLVGTWRIKEPNVTCWGLTVSFYAVSPYEVNILLSNLKDFSKQLPDTVNDRFYIHRP